MSTLTGKRALVTGAGAGIGLATARMFAEHGARVVGLDRVSGATPVDGVDFVSGDVTSDGDIAEAVARASGDDGLDILVANAGILLLEDWLTADPAAWAQVVDVNLIGVMRCVQAAAKAMVPHGRGGRLLATASIAGVRPYADTPAYSATKAGVIAVMRSAAVAFAAHRITANAVAPGEVDTTMSAQAVETMASAQARPPKVMRAEAIAAVPLGRLADPSEVASAFLFLASEEAAYITGATFIVDGGLLLRT